MTKTVIAVENHLLHRALHYITKDKIQSRSK